jgi:uncharacterized membrane protein
MNRNLLATVILLILDFTWISLFMGKQYKSLVKKVQKSEMQGRLQYALLSYILMVLGLNIFVLPNISKENALLDSIKYGFIFGIILYGVYDFTAAAVLDNWDIQLAIVDILWGGFVFFISSYISTIAS